jgi:hypothetical protein
MEFTRNAAQGKRALTRAQQPSRKCVVDDVRRASTASLPLVERHALYAHMENAPFPFVIGVEKQIVQR